MLGRRGGSFTPKIRDLQTILVIFKDKRFWLIGSLLHLFVESQFPRHLEYFVGRMKLRKNGEVSLLIVM